MALGRNLKKVADEAARKAKEQARKAAKSSAPQKKAQAASVKNTATQVGRKATQAAAAKKTGGTQQTRRATPASSTGRNVGQQAGEKVKYFSNKKQTSQGLVKNTARGIGTAVRTGQPAHQNSISAAKAAANRMVERTAPQMSSRLDQKLNLAKQQNELLRLTRRNNALSGFNRYQDELYGVKTPWPSYMSRPAQRELTAAEQAEITRLEGVIESLRVPMQNSGTVRTKEGVTWGVSGPSSWEQVGPDAVKWHDETVAELQKQIDDIKSRAYETTTPRYYSLRNKTPLDVLKADGWTKLWSGKTMSENAQELRDTRPREQVQREIVRGAKDKFTNALRNAAISQEKVSSYDKENLSPDQLRSVQEAKYYYRRGATQEERDAQHMNAEQVRAGQGYSGGVSGDKYISPEVPFEVRKQLNDDGIIAWKQAEMKRQKAVTEDEIAKADAQKQEVLDTPAYRKYNRAKEALSAIGNRVGGSWVGLGETTNAMMNADFEADVEKRWGDVSLQTLVVRHKKAQEALEEFDRNIAEKGYDPQGRNRVVLQNDVLSLEAALDRRTNPKKYEALTTVSPDSLGQRMARAAQEHTENATRGLGTLGRYATQAAIMTGEVLPTMALAPFSGGGSLLAMGAQAAGSKMNELNATGTAPAESWVRGGLSGISAAVTEKIPLERLGKLLKGQAGRNLVLAIMGNIGVEIGTEEADEVANTVMDYAFKDPNAEWSWEDIRDTAILTAISAGFLNVPAATVGRITQGKVEESQLSQDNQQARMGETSASVRSRSDMQMTQAVNNTTAGAVDLTQTEPNARPVTQQDQAEIHGRSQPQIADIQQRTRNQAEIIQQAQDVRAEEREEEARQLKADVQAYQALAQAGALSAEEKAMTRAALEERYAELAGQALSQAITEQAASQTLEEAAAQKVQADFPPLQYERSRFPASSFMGAFLDAAPENNARNQAEERARAAQEAEREGKMQQVSLQRETRTPAQTATETRTNPADAQTARAVLARNIGSFDENGRKAIMAAYQEGGDVSAYYKDFAKVYNQALNGTSQENISRPEGLTWPQYQAAVFSGQNDRAATAGQETGRQPAKKVTANANAGFVADGYAKSVLDKNGVKMLDGYGRITGTRIRFVDQSEMDSPWSRGEIIGNEIRLSKQRVRNSQDAAVFVAGHEITHRMKDMGVAEYNDLVDYVMGMEEYVSKVDSIIRGYAARDVSLSRSEAIDEVVANFVGETILDTESLRNFIARNAGNRSLLERFLEAVRDLASKLTGREKTTVDEAVRLLESALRSAKQKAAEMENGTTDATKTRNSFEIDRDDVTALRGIDRKSINDFTTDEIQRAEKWARKFWQELNVKSPFFRAWFGDWRALSTEPVALPEIDLNATPTSGNAMNQDTGRKMSWDKKAARESVLNASAANKGDIQIISSNMGEVVKNAVLLDTVVSQPDSKRKMSGTAFMHSFYTVVPVKGRQALVKMFAEEAYSQKQDTVFTRAYALKYIEKVADLDYGVHPEKGLSSSQSATTFSVADLFALVKQYDKDFHPKEPSQVVNEDGTPKVVYHGTLANGLNEFRKDYIGSRYAADDVGFFFASRESIAKDYAVSEFDSETRGEVIPAYLGIKKPLVFNGRYARANGYGDVFRDNDVIDVWDNFQGAILDELEGQDYDGIILDDGIDQMYVAFEPTQIKSATENVGTFDKDNPDIRYSLDLDDQGRELSEGQQEYFRDSKIRTRDGSLMTVYHGTANAFTAFDVSRSGENYDGWSEFGPGLYFTPDKKLAQFFADEAGWGRETYLMEGYLNVTNPFDVMRGIEFDISDLQTEYDLTDFDVRFLKGAGYRLIKFMQEHDINAMNYLKAKGYDGVWDPDNKGEPSQIVSYNGNTFKAVENTAPTEDPDIHYSLDGSLEEARLIRENQKLRDKLDFWRRQVKKTDRSKAEPSQVKKLAKKMASDYSSDMDVEDITAGLQEIYDGIGGGWTYDQARAAAADLAQAMVEQATETDGYLYYEYKPMRQFFRETPIVVSPEVARGIPDFNAWRKGQMGRLRLQIGEQTNIDTVFQEAAVMWPEFFDEETSSTSLDQVERIADVLDSVYRQDEYNPFGDDLAAPAQYLTREILDAYWDVPAIKKTFADRMQDRLNRQKNMTAEVKRAAQEREDALKERISAAQKELAEAGRELRAAQRETAAAEKGVSKDIASLEKEVERLEKKLREEQGKARWELAEARLIADWQKASAIRAQERRVEGYQKALRDTRAARDAQVKRMKENYLGKKRAASQRQKERERRAQIMRHARDLTARLNRPTDKKNVPQPLRETVLTMLESINLASKDGKPTKRTQAFEALRDQFQAARKAGDPMVIDESLFGDSDEGIRGNFDAVIAMHDIPIANMNMDQLNTVWQTVRAVEHAITTYGRTLSSKKYERINEWTNALAEEAKTRRPMKHNALILDLETPYTYFSQYGDSGLAIYRMLRDAQDREQFMTDEIMAAAEKIVNKEQVKEWNRRRHTFTVEWTEVDENGHDTKRTEDLTLTTAQIMDLYNLSKRPQARDHLLKGGIVQPEIKAGGKNIERGTDVIHLDATTMSEIIGKLTDTQRQVADKLQKLTTGILAKWGNEASMTAYGYEKFNDPHYWSIRTAKEGIHSSVERNRDNPRSTKNMGLAMATVPHASNALDLLGAFDNFSRHAMEMINYAAWLNPMEDAERIFNWEFQDGAGNKTGRTVKHILDKVGGKKSQNYWMNLMSDIQNGIRSKSRTTYGRMANKIIGNAKAAAVGANARVVIQQPTAYMRAFAVMDPADLTRGILGAPTNGFGWRKAKKYAGIAARKAIGSFDVTASNRATKTIFGQKTFLEWLSDVSGALASGADAVTWRAIWNAAEWKTKRENPDLTLGSDAFYRQAAEYFTDTIDQTQVVDGVMQRSQLMRDSGEIVKQAAAFMGESIMSMNLVFRNFNNYRYQQDPKKRTEARKAFARATTAFTATCIVNALAQSVVDGIRDDDKDRKYLERLIAAFIGTDFEDAKAMAESLAEAIKGKDQESMFLERLAAEYRERAGEDASFWKSLKDVALEGNLVDNLNPLNSIPFLSDLMSILNGYDVTRADADVIADIFKSSRLFLETWFGNGKYTKQYATANFLAQIGKLFGIPGHTIIRDITGGLRTYAVESDNIPFLYELEKAIYSNTSDKNKKNFLEIAWAALLDNDWDTFDHIREDLMDGGVINGKQMDDAMKKKVKEELANDPNFTLGDKIMDLLGFVNTYAQESEDEEEKFDAKNLDHDQYDAYSQERAQILRAGEDELLTLDAFNDLEDEAKDKTLKALYKYAEQVALEHNSDGQFEITDSTVTGMKDATEHDITPAQYSILKGATNDIGNAKTQDGEEIYNSASILKREAMEATGVPLSDEGRTYMYGELNVSAEVQGYSAAEFEQAVADVHAQEQSVSKYSKYGADYKDQVKGVYEFKKNARADKDANGKAIPGSAKKKVEAEIAKLPLPNTAKREIYLDMGYAASTCPF